MTVVIQHATRRRGCRHCQGQRLYSSIVFILLVMVLAWTREVAAVDNICGVNYSANFRFQDAEDLERQIEEYVKTLKCTTSDSSETRSPSSAPSADNVDTEGEKNPGRTTPPSTSDGNNEPSSTSSPPSQGPGDVSDSFALPTTAKPSPEIPSSAPSTFPSLAPSAFPSRAPTAFPSLVPSAFPSHLPTYLPTSHPVRQNAERPSFRPTSLPSRVPTASPSDVPSQSPSQVPTLRPSPEPTPNPTLGPTNSPQPTGAPTVGPTAKPTTSPTKGICEGYTDVERAAAMTDELSTVSDVTLLDDKKSDQYASLSWLLEEDEALLCPDSANLVQRYVAVLFYFSTNGDSWHSCSRFAKDTPCKNSDGSPRARHLSASHECDWAGHTCDGNQDIVKIHLEVNNLGGNLPNEISNLPFLFDFDVDTNHIGGTIPSSFGLLKYLMFFDIDENQLEGTIPEELYDLPLLRSLDMDTNKLTGTISSRLGQMQLLYIAQFDQNKLRGTIPSSLGDLTNLGYLTIVGNDFTGPIPEEVCNSSFELYASCDLCSTVADCCTQCQSEG